jgi:hypothetical protein
MSPFIPNNLRHNSPFPMSMQRKLQFNWNGYLMGSSPFILKEFRANSAFSPDGVGTPSGFNELAAIYNFYKVLKLNFYYRVVGNETGVPVQFGVIIRDVQPSTVITTYTQALNALEVSPSTRIDVVGQTNGMSRFESIEYKIDLGSVIGNRLEYLADVDYKGLTSANPVQALWIDFVLVSSNTAINLTNGAFVEIFLSLSTIFYSTRAELG